jgi:hypothetical protein
LKSAESKYDLQIESMIREIANMVSEIANMSWQIENMSRLGELLFARIK